jgi:hypothetical protein
VRPPRARSPHAASCRREDSSVQCRRSWQVVGGWQRSVEHLAHQYGGKVWSNAADTLQGCDLLGSRLLGVAVSASSRSVSNSRISSKVSTSRRRRRSSSARSNGGSLRPSPVRSSAMSPSHERSQRRPSPNALREQQRLDPVLDPQPLLNKVLAFAVRPLGVLLLRRRYMHHAAYLPVGI